MIGVEGCPCDTCVYKTVAAKMAYLYVKADHHRDGGPSPSEVELEREAATFLGAAVATERDRRAGRASDQSYGGSTPPSRRPLGGIRLHD